MEPGIKLWKNRIIKSLGFIAMKKINYHLALGFTLFFINISPLHAAISSLVGDIDGFGGASALSNPPNGFNLTCCFDNRNAEDPIFTDVWSFQAPEIPQTINYTHNYDPSSLLAPVSFATLSIQSAGMGNDRGPWSVLFNGVQIGSIGGPGTSIGSGEVVTNFFDIPLILLSISGADHVSLIFQESSADGFAINYSLLELTSVPLPGALIFFASALTILRTARKSFKPN